jgi:hypothetical protein
MAASLGSVGVIYRFMKGLDRTTMFTQKGIALNDAAWYAKSGY